MQDTYSSKAKTIAETLSGNRYPGRGILLGVSPDGRKAVTVYFIMGRSENSRNRVFIEEGRTLKVIPFDETKVQDPSLVIYTARRCEGNMLIVTNGDQTDTIADACFDRTFEEALFTRTFEPDPPIFTPRISGMTELPGAGAKSAAGSGDAGERKVSYKLSILKRSDSDEAARFFYNYPGVPGVGHLIHTYGCGDDPSVWFFGEPKKVAIGDDISGFAREVWDALDADNRVSLFAAYTDIETGEEETVVINKNR